MLPESLGGYEKDILTEGLFCDKCQNKFGSKVEAKVLHNYPFILTRILAGIATKKGKSPRLEYRQGTLESIGGFGNIRYKPDPYFKKAYESGQKIHTIVENKYHNQLLIRFLLKMALQTIGYDTKLDKVFRQEFDGARTFALNGTKKYKWPLMIKENMGLQNEYIVNRGRNLKQDHVFIDYNVQYNDDGKDEIFYLKYFYLELVTPVIVNKDTALKFKNINLGANESFYEV